MRTFSRIISLLMIFFAALLNTAQSQTGVLNPDDPIVIYNSASPPATPPYGTLAKWVKTNRVSFTTTSFKAYFYKGIAFRLKFPKTYKDSINTNKKYPIFVFFHGIGEKGSIYDNEYQLYHGGQKHRDNVDNGSFDGFLLYIQSSSGSGAFNNTHFSVVDELIRNYFVPQVKVDINRVMVDGLSAGGGAVWQMLRNYPRLVTAALPISACSVADGDASMVSSNRFTPIWIFQGGLDHAPDPFTTHGVVNNYTNAGGNIKLTEYPNLGHGAWNQAWSEADFCPFMNRVHKANPWPLFGRTEFCPSDPINQVLGVTAGFQGYEWRKNGVLIPGASANTYTATSIGIYSCRIKRDTTWSVWSPTPVEIKLKGATVSPNIQTNGFFSNLIPAPDGNTSVSLMVPAGYASYEWQKDGDPTVLSTTRFLVATTPGNYKVRVTEQFGCSSSFSNLFPVINANGPNGPPPPSSIVANPISKTAIKLDWSQNPSPPFNETGFEIYRSESASGPYVLIAITAQNVVTYTNNDLNPNTEYFYKLRGINTNAASTVSDPVSATTLADNSAPTAPGNLRIASTTRNSVQLIWDQSTDDVEVFEYDIYVNGVKFYESDVPQATVFNLQHGQTYNFRVQARDFAGNLSPFSNQVSGTPLSNGLSYKYYTYTGSWTSLPNFSLLDPVATGVVPNVTLAGAQEDNFGFLWEGYLNVTQSGTYNFRTNSDDGSKLYLGPLNGTVSPYSYSATALVNNDGLHGAQNATSANITLAVGVYPIAITFYEEGGGQSMTVSWRRNSGSYSTIPNSAFADVPVVNGQPPTKPSGLVATTVSFKKINLSWTDNSNNETGFEIWRAAAAAGPFTIIGSTTNNITTFSDSVGLSANTTYYYGVKSIGQFGESSLATNFNFTDAVWQFNNNYNDASGNNNTLSQNNTPTFDAASKMEGTHSVSLNGTNQSINLNTSSGDYIRGGYTEKTIAFWMRSNANTGTRILADLGGSDNGLAFALDANRLYGGIASGSTRVNISIPYTYANTVWNHIALVYNVNSLKMYLNGTEVVANNSLSFSSVGTTSNASRIGTTNSSNAFNTGTAFYNGRLDNFSVFNKALTQAQIANVMNNVVLLQSKATTLALPALPAAPSALVASGVSTSAIDVTWNDNSSTETKFELYRSALDNTNFILYKTLDPNTNSFQDTALFANSIFYYKVRAVNDGGNSAYSNEDSAASKNHIPVLTPIANQFVRHGTQLLLNVQSTDEDPEILNVQISNLPGFGSYASNGNGTGVITFNPLLAHVGTYNNITVQVTDEHGGVAVTSFNLTVNSNDNPVLSSVSNVNVNENQTAQVDITATDANPADVLTWSFTGMPSFATVTTNTGSVHIDLAPGYAGNGSYTVGVRVEDGNDGSDTASFVITVNDVNPNKTIYVNFNDGTNAAPLPWNNTNKVPALNDNFANLKDDAGATTTVGLQLLTTWSGVNNAGANTGNNSGVYPDAVLRSSYFTNTTNRTVRIYGLNTGDKYTFTFMSSRANPTVGVVTNYTIGAQTVSLNAANNTQNTVSIEDIQPAVDGTVTLNVSTAAGSSFAYMNSMVIKSIYDDATAPAKPRDLGAETFNGAVRLTWIDAAYNEAAYEVYRSGSLNGTYTLLNPGGNNAGLQLYDDENVTGHTTYYYFVKALNSYGNTNSDTIAFTTPNTPPILNAIANVNMSTNQVVDVNITATDEPGDIITLSATGLPAFATLTDNGNGTGVIHIAPGVVSGYFPNITVTATDNNNASASRQFSISVANANITTVYVNFNQTLPAGAPWNNTNSAPTAGLTLNNLLDNSGTGTGANLSLLDSWTGQTATGYSTGNNSGLYPDNVMVNSYYYNSTATGRRIQLSGLSTAKRYNLIFFASRMNNPTPLTTRYTVGAQSVELNAQNNTSTTVRINDLAPDASGNLQITAQGVVGPNAYIGALVIESYTPSATAEAPTNLTAAGISKTQIKLNWNSVANTGYEVWRSSTATGTYTKRADVPVNTTTYTDNGLTEATVYYYKVKSVLNGNPSPFSNYAGASTVAYTLNLNLNDGTANAPAQGGNWNNTNALVADGYTLQNMINDQGQNTGINFNVATTFSGFNYYGTTTGNNSGVYPDNAMKSFYYCNYADTARLRVDGLTLAHVYNLVFFGSRVNPLVGVVTAYKIGNTVVTLNAANNTTNVVKIAGVVPDEDGGVDITIYGTISGGFGYLNVMSIEGAIAVPQDPSGNYGRGILIAPTNNQEQHQYITATDSITNKGDQARITKPNTEPEIGSAVVYPNPFEDDVTLKLDLKKNTSQLSIIVTDINGRIIHKLDVKDAPKGILYKKLGINGRALKSGIYFIKVFGPTGKMPEDLKIIKQ